MGCASSTPVVASPPPSATTGKPRGSLSQVGREAERKSSSTPPSTDGIEAKPESAPALPSAPANVVVPESQSVSSNTTGNSTDNLSEMSGASASILTGIDLSVPNKQLDSSHHRRKSRQNLTHADSKVGLNEIICGDLKNPNLVRIEVPLGKPIEEVYEGVHDGVVLGSGISGIVREVKHRTTQVSYAVKCLDLALIENEEGLRQLKEEIYIMCQLDHPNIVRLEEVYESHSEIYLVQEVCKGGELFDRLDEQPDYHYTEAQCARLVKQMLSSVRYIHNKGIIHRDLKLENFLFSNMDNNSELKMIDFGLSKHFTFGEVHHDAVGTPYTVAPEVIRGNYDERCDVWAIGVITYLLLSGEPPFGGCGGPETLIQVRDNILRGAFEFEPADVWEDVSQEAKDFIKSLLVVDPVKRPTARQAKESEWLKMWSKKENGGRVSAINPNVVKALVGFKEYSDMRKLLCEVLSFTLLPEQIQDLRREFEKYDQEGTGEITLSTLKKVLIGNASTGSLGGLSEDEVEDIFNAMRVRKGETSIHWHDFIAAGLSQCQVDDRNLRLAFERLDPQKNGYITFDNVMDLMGNETFENEDDMIKMWMESMQDVNCKSALITYEDFVLLMKGQKRERDSRAFIGTGQLGTVPETLNEEDEEHHPPTPSDLGPSGKTMPLDGDAAAIGRTAASSPKASPRDSPSHKTFMRLGSNSAPATPNCGPRYDTRPESPMSVDEGQLRVSFTGNGQYEIPELDLTPPQTPVRGPTDYITPTVGRATLDPSVLSRLVPPDLALPGVVPRPSAANGLPGSRALHMSLTQQDIHRGRSASLDEKDTLVTTERIQLFKRDSRRALAMPEHLSGQSDIDKVISDQSETNLVVNRKLYRAHREFRHAVTEACKRFEDEQMRRAKETLRARESAKQRHTAGLVMRHGQTLSEGSIKTFLKKSLEEQQKKVDKANRRGGRGRRSRKKTISDMSGMLGGSAPPLPVPEPLTSYTRATTLHAPSTPKPEESLTDVPGSETPKEAPKNTALRNPTKPGEFIQTNYDPFQRKSIKFDNTNSSPVIGVSPMFMPRNSPPPLTLNTTE